MSLLRTRHLYPIGHTLLSTWALCNLHVTVTLILLYRRLKLSGIILRAFEIVCHKYIFTISYIPFMDMMCGSDVQITAILWYSSACMLVIIIIIIIIIINLYNYFFHADYTYQTVG